MASTAKKALKGSGKRRHYGGKCVMRIKVRGGYVDVPRSHTHGGHSQAIAGFTAGDIARFPQGVRSNDPRLGPFKVPEPTKRSHRRGFYRSAS